MDRTTLSGQVALVTGAGSGIGRACAVALARAGAAVVVNHPGTEAAAASVVAEIAGFGGTAHAIAADVSDEDQVRAMFDAACAACGTIHILVNNAGIQPDAGIAEMTPAQGRDGLARKSGGEGKRG